MKKNRKLIYVHAPAVRSDEDLLYFAVSVQRDGHIPIIPETTVRRMLAAGGITDEEAAAIRGRMAFLVESCDELWVIGDVEEHNDKRVVRLATAIHIPIRTIKYSDMLASRAGDTFGRAVR